MIENRFLSPSESDAKLIELGMRIRAYRVSRGWTLKDMAARLFCSINTYRALEAGKPTASLGLLANALWVLGAIDDLDQIASSPISNASKKRARKSLNVNTPGKISEGERDF